jgi:hypothetical protein
VTKASDNSYPSVLFTEGTVPSSPAAGKRRLYINSTTHAPKLVDSSGVETYVGTGSLWTTGTSMPGSPATNQRVTRTDLGLDFYWNGSLWVTTTLYIQSFGTGDSLTPNTLNATFGRAYPGLEQTFSRLYLERFQAGTFVSGTNNGSNYWTVNVLGSDASNVTNFTTSADTGSTWTAHATAPAAQIAASLKDLELTSVKTGAPGGLFVAAVMAYRLVTT